MRVDKDFRDGALVLRIAERALVKHPDWEGLGVLGPPDAPVVAIDFAGVDFVSSLFLQGCVELGRSLAQHGAHLLLLNLSASQRALLDLIEGASCLKVVDREAELAEVVASLAQESERAAQDEGVHRIEKRTLWS